MLIIFVIVGLILCFAFYFVFKMIADFRDVLRDKKKSDKDEKINQ